MVRTAPPPRRLHIRLHILLVALLAALGIAVGSSANFEDAQHASGAKPQAGPAR